MKKTLTLTTTALALALLASPAFAAEFTIKESGTSFTPDNLTIQPGDTVTFVNGENKKHDVMFVNVPKGVDEMIMSPMLKKKGEKYSYTFTVPGTYQFHCHPHEDFGMKGVLIVGSPSKAGETVAMDHHKMSAKTEITTTAHVHTADHHLEAKGIEATGTVNAVDAAKRTINLTHDPIKALGWPKMKMQFNVDKVVDLKTLKAGDAVMFTLKAKGEDNYEIVTISKK